MDSKFWIACKKALGCTAFSAFALMLLTFAAPRDANVIHAAADAPSLAVAAFVLPPFTTEAPRAERCEVPVLGWRYYGQKMLQKKCAPARAERATVRVRADIPKDGMMAFILEWQIVRNGKIKFRCTGPRALYFDTDNRGDRYYTWTAQPGQDIQAVNLYVTTTGWNTLNWDTSAKCVSP